MQAMRAYIFALLSLLAAFNLASPAQSQAKSEVFNSEQVADLSETVVAFQKSFAANDVKGILVVMPPKIWAFIRDANKVTDEQLMQGITKALEDTMKTVKILGYRMDVAAATSHQLSDGGYYMLVPTVTEMSITDGEKIVVSSSTLALFEEGKWYLVRINDPQQRAILAQVYPIFAGVTFPEETTETVKQ